MSSGMSNNITIRADRAFRRQLSFRSTEREAFINGYIARYKESSREPTREPEIPMAVPCKPPRPEYYNEIHGGEFYERELHGINWGAMAVFFTFLGVWYLCLC